MTYNQANLLLETLAYGMVTEIIGEFETLYKCKDCGRRSNFGACFVEHDKDCALTKLRNGFLEVEE